MRADRISRRKMARDYFKKEGMKKEGYRFKEFWSSMKHIFKPSK